MSNAIHTILADIMEVERPYGFLLTPKEWLNYASRVQGGLWSKGWVIRIDAPVSQSAEETASKPVK